MSIARYVWLALVGELVWVGAARGQQTPAEQWRAAAEAARQRPDCVRFYSFKTPDAVQSNAVGSAGPMTFRSGGGDALTTGVGRVAGTCAVVLDASLFESPALDGVSNALTVSVWICPLAMGKKTGNDGAANGMIVSSGTGYYDGWRLAVFDWKTRCPTFEIGRAKGSFSVTAKDGLTPGFWNHLAVTWDGEQVRLYVNGMLSAEAACAEPAVAPDGGLRIGYSGYGLGSLRMAADELAVFRAALSPEAVAALSLSAPLPTEPLAALIQRAQAAVKSPGPEMLSVRAGTSVPSAWLAWAKLGVLRVARMDDAERIAAYAAIFEGEDVPSHLRGMAAEALADVCRRGMGSEVPSRVLMRLPACWELDAQEQRLFGLALGASELREKNAEMACTVYTQMLTAADATPDETAEVRQGLARALRQKGDAAGAREQYAAIQADIRVSASARALAALGAAQTWQDEGLTNETERAYRALAERGDMPAILREEAASAAACVASAQTAPHRARLAPFPSPGVAFFVSPKGDDQNPGTLEHPFATLQRARDAVRRKIAAGKNPPGGVTVYVRGGRYAVTHPLMLTEQDSGSFGSPVVYRAWQDERPVFDGGFHVHGLKKVRDPAVLARLPSEARGWVYVADVRAQGFQDLAPQAGYGTGFESRRRVCELFEDGVPLPVARWPNEGMLTVGEVADPTNWVFVCATNRLARWERAADPMASGYWKYLWAQCTVPVASIDPAAETITLAEKPGYGLEKGRPFYMLNLLEEIDRPGEWYLDRAAGKLYVWPKRHPWWSRLVLSAMPQAFIVAKQTREVAFIGLTFEFGQEDGVILDQCVNATVAGCVIRRLGGTGLTVAQGANVRLYGNALSVLGHTGMRVSGGNRMNLTPGQIQIENNDVSDISRLARTYCPALLLEGCGARVAHNHFHDAPSSAMRIEGNDHLIEYNQVDHVVRESDDQGALDMWGDPSYRGVVIRYNRWQDIGGGHAPCGQSGIRLDDAICGVWMYGNLFERASNGHFGGIQIHGGKDNVIDNNLFVDCRLGVSFSPWGQKRWTEFLARAESRKNLYEQVNIRVPPYSKRYPALAALMEGVDRNSVWRNVFIGGETLFYHAPAAVDAWENRWLARLPAPPELSSGTLFLPLPLDEIGPYDDPLRARLSE